MLTLIPTSCGNVPDAPQQVLPRAEIEPLEAAILRASSADSIRSANPRFSVSFSLTVPAIADEHAVLILTAGHVFELDALAVAARPAQQEGCVLVPGVGRVARLSRDVAREVEDAARARPKLRLPVIELVADEIEPGAELVRASQLRQVRRNRVALLVTLERMPRGVVSDACSDRAVERRHAALTRVRAVRSRNAESLRSRSRCRSPSPAAVWSCQFMPKLPSISIVGLRLHVCPTVATYALVSPSPPSSTPRKYRFDTLACIVENFAKNLMRRAPVPVHLHVVVVAIRRRRARQEQVVLKAVVGARVVRRRIERLDLLRNTADPIRRNHRARELCPAGAVGIAGQPGRTAERPERSTSTSLKSPFRIRAVGTV